jgi:hypothetical protein
MTRSGVHPKSYAASLGRGSSGTGGVSVIATNLCETAELLVADDVSVTRSPTGLAAKE